MSLQISDRESADIAILDLHGRWTIDDSKNELLNRHLEELVSNGARNFLLNLADVTQIEALVSALLSRVIVPSVVRGAT